MTVLHQYLNLEPAGGSVVAVCSSHPVVLNAAMSMARVSGRTLLIEATANQVNQYGGYTGMTPSGFRDYINSLAQAAQISGGRIVTGADHLGPHVWRNKPARTAMENATVLVRECVSAGFRKIHLDTVAGCLDDPCVRLSPGETADRAVFLCRAAEEQARDRAEQDRPVYVIGHEVPVPGGGLRQGPDADVPVTSAQDLDDTLRIFRDAFYKAGLQGAWERTAAVVVQPGIDFGDWDVCPYRSEKAGELSAFSAQLPDGMVFEVHAADYQAADALRQMAADHFRLLKIGPCLTFAFREAVYALAHIEQAWPSVRYPSNIKATMEALMLENPRHWQSNLSGETQDFYFLRHFSLKDRIRYYWSHPRAMQSLNRLLQNLSRPLPKSLSSQYLPDLFAGMAADAQGPRTLIRRKIENVLRPCFDIDRA